MDAEPIWMIGDSLVADIAAAGILGVLVPKHHTDALNQCDELSHVSAILQKEMSTKVANVIISQQTDWRQ